MKIGLAFTDHVKTERIPKRHYFRKTFRVRRFILLVLLLIVGSLLLGRLFFVQVVQGNYYRLLSDSNRIKTHILHAPRGGNTTNEWFNNTWMPNQLHKNK